MENELAEHRGTFRFLKKRRSKCTAKSTKNRPTHSIKKLNNDQKNAYQRLIKEFTSDLHPKTGKIVKSKVITLDAPPGTGKSYLITILLRNIKLTHKVIVYRRDLAQAYMDDKVKGQTTFSFLNGIYKFVGGNLQDIFKVCNDAFDDELTHEQSLLKVYKNIMEMKVDVDILILDEYTVASPWLILCLVHAGRRLQTHIVFTGDGDQLNSINSSQYHDQTNRSLATAVSDDRYILEQQMRITDLSYNKILEDLKGMFHPTMETDLTFDIVYFLYTRLKRKFQKDDFEAMYLSGLNVNLKNRQKEIVKYWVEEENQEVHYEYIKFATSEYDLTDFKKEHGKFATVLPLVLNKIYMYGHQQFVKLLAIESDYLEASYCDTNEWITIYREDIWKCGFHTELTEWLKAQCFVADCCASVKAYPIRLPLSTYHSIQGTTISDMQVVLDLDDVKANAIYVGLSRLRSPKQLAGIRSSLLNSLRYTERRDDDYFYSINCVEDGVLLPDIPISDIKQLTDIQEFATEKEMNCRILKSAFAKDESVTEMTGIIQISQFLTTYSFLLENTYTDTEILQHFAAFTRIKDEEDIDKVPKTKRTRIQ